MHEEPTVGQLMTGQMETVQPIDAVITALERLAHDGSSSIIVVENGVPVGVLDRGSVDQAPETMPNQKVEDVMLRNVPLLTREMSLDRARDFFRENRTDRFPVVDERGSLVGELRSSALAVDEVPTDDSRPVRPAPRVIDANDPDSVLEDARRDMGVIANDGTIVGTVQEVLRNALGRRTSVIVQYGRFTKRRKLVDGKLVDLVDDDLVMLSIDPQQFKQLPDANPAD
jgi:CBS domain-containing protein